MATIKKFNVLSVGKVLGVLYAIMGFFFGGIYTIFALVAAGLSGSMLPGIYGLIFGVGSIIILPLFYAVIGFVGGIISAFLYNLIAGWIGGIEVEVQ